MRSKTEREREGQRDKRRVGESVTMLRTDRAGKIQVDCDGEFKNGREGKREFVEGGEWTKVRRPTGCLKKGETV